MDRKWAETHLAHFIEITRLSPRQYEIGTFDVLTHSQDDILRAAQVVEQILDRVTPTWRRDIAPDVSGDWQPQRAAAVRAASELANGDEIAAKLGDNAPVMTAAAMHPWAWQGARSLWQSGHFAEAVRAAAVQLNAETQNKLGRPNLSETTLFQQAFSADSPSATTPRLRPPGDDSSRTAVSVRRGIVALAEGSFAALRNPASHNPGEEMEERVALEALATISLVCRYVDACTVVTS